MVCSSVATRFAAIRGHFLPEFIGRLDGIVIFNKLGTAQVRDIVDIRLKELQKRMDDNGKKIVLDVDNAAKDWLGAAGVSPIYGARPLAGVIQNNVLIPLSRYIIDESIQENETARVRFDAERNRVVVVPNHEVAGGAYDDESMDVDDLDGPEVEQLD